MIWVRTGVTMVPSERELASAIPACISASIKHTNAAIASYLIFSVFRTPSASIAASLTEHVRRRSHHLRQSWKMRHAKNSCDAKPTAPWGSYSAGRTCVWQ